MPSRKSRIIVVAGIALIASASAMRILGRQPHAAAEAAADAGTPRAAVARVERGAISNTVTIAGEFLPYQEVELHAKVAGYIRKINVDIGDRVQAGEVLAVLEVPELNAQVDGADASVRHSREEIVREQHEVKRSEASHEALHAEALRLQQASDTRPGLIAQQELDDAKAKDVAAEAQVESSKSALAAAQQQLGVTQANKSQVSAMQDYSRITAPFTGVVTARYADTGALVQAGTSSNAALPVVRLAQVDVLRLRVPVPESMAGRIGDGAAAQVYVQATGQRFQANVTRLTGSFDRATRTMQVEIDVKNQNGHLTPGMYADVTLTADSAADAATIPVEAVRHEGSASSVLLLDSDNRIVKRTVHTGLEDASRVEVTDGLHPGDRVVVGNLSSFQVGQIVDPKPRTDMSAVGGQ